MAGRVVQQIFRVVQDQRPTPALQRGEQLLAALEGLFAHQLAECELQQAGVAMTGDIDEGHILARRAAAMGGGQRQFGLAHAGQPFQHHHCVVGQILFQRGEALLVIDIVFAARRQLRQPAQAVADAARHWRHRRRRRAEGGGGGAQEQDRPRPGQAALVHAAARPRQRDFQIAVGAGRPGVDEFGRQLGHRRGFHCGERRQHRSHIADLRVEQRFGHAGFQRTEAASTVAAPQQGQIDLAAAHVAGEIGGGDFFAGVGREAGVVAVVQQQPAAGAQAMADPQQHMRFLGGQGVGQTAPGCLPQRREPGGASARIEPLHRLIVTAEQGLVQRRAAVVGHIRPGHLHPRRPRLLAVQAQRPRTLAAGPAHRAPAGAAE